MREKRDRDIASAKEKHGPIIEQITTRRDYHLNRIEERYNENLEKIEEKRRHDTDEHEQDQRTDLPSPPSATAAPLALLDPLRALELSK